MYRGQNRIDVPPHIFAIAESAFHTMIQEVLYYYYNGVVNLVKGNAREFKAVICFVLFIGRASMCHN